MATYIHKKGREYIVDITQCHVCSARIGDKTTCKAIQITKPTGQQRVFMHEDCAKLITGWNRTEVIHDIDYTT